MSHGFFPLHLSPDSYREEDVAEVTSADIRPRARYRLQWDQVSIGNNVMVNHNADMPSERGFWYDAVISRKDEEKKEIYAKILLG